jgi:hypothetical protein
VSLQPALHRHQQVWRIPRLDHVTKHLATVDRLHQDVNVGETGEDDSDRMRQGNQRVAQKFDPGHVGHALVGHDDRDIVVLLD